MPQGNGTGPMGMGPMTGKGLGCCTGYTQPMIRKSLNSNCYGLGRRGMGWKHGWQRQWSPVLPNSTTNELEALRSEVEVVIKHLDAVNKRITDLMK